MSEDVKQEIKKEIKKINSAQEGKYLSFALGNEIYGVGILDVREIIGMMDITAVPQMPKYIKGVINLRGKVIPVIDLRLKFGMESVEYTEETCIIVLSVSDTLMGVLVDRVCEVLDIARESIEDTPDFGSRVNTDFILGLGKIEDQVTMLLDIQRILTEDVVIAEQKVV